jgi:hypothetical protein
LAKALNGLCPDQKVVFNVADHPTEGLHQEAPINPDSNQTIKIGSAEKNPAHQSRKILQIELTNYKTCPVSVGFLMFGVVVPDFDHQLVKGN